MQRCLSYHSMQAMTTWQEGMLPVRLQWQPHCTQCMLLRWSAAGALFRALCMGCVRSQRQGLPFAQEERTNSIGEELRMVMKSERGGRLARDSAELLVGDRPGEFMVVTEEGSAIPVAVRELAGRHVAGLAAPLPGQPQLQEQQQQQQAVSSPFQRASAAAAAAAALEEGREASGAAAAAEQLPAENGAAGEGPSAAAPQEAEGTPSSPAPTAQPSPPPSREGTPTRTWWGSVTAALGLKGGTPPGSAPGSPQPAAPLRQGSGASSGEAAPPRSTSAALQAAQEEQEQADAAAGPGQGRQAPALGEAEAAPSPVSAFAAEVAVMPVSAESADSSAVAGESRTALPIVVAMSAGRESRDRFRSQ